MAANCLAFHAHTTGLDVLTVDGNLVVVSRDGGLTWDTHDIGATSNFVTACWTRGGPDPTGDIAAASAEAYWPDDLFFDLDTWPEGIFDLHYLRTSNLIYVANRAWWASISFVYGGCGIPWFDGPVATNDQFPPLCLAVDEGFRTVIGMEDGLWYSPNSMAGSLGAVSDASTPSSITLAPVYPNPFNGTATVSLDVSAPGPITLAVFDVLGRQVATLHDGPLAPGRHRFTWQAGTAPSGSYLLRAGDSHGSLNSQRLTLVK